MARPPRNNVDYFPHECIHGRKMFVVESKYGNDGYAVWFKLLERLGNTDNHYLNLSDETELMYLASLMKIDEIKFKNILTDLAKLGAIDKELYEENKIVWSQKFYESIQDAYSKRNNKCIDRNSLVLLLVGLGIRKQDKSIRKLGKDILEGVINPQSIEEYIKEKKIEEELPHNLRLYISKNFPNVSKLKTQLSNKECIELYRTKPHELLQTVCKYSVRNNLNRLMNIEIPETDVFNTNWLYYAARSPVWDERIIEQGGTIDHDTQTVVFEHDEQEEAFYEVWPYQPDELPVETKQKMVGYYAKTISQMTLKDFCTKYGVELVLLKLIIKTKTKQKQNKNQEKQ